MKIQWLPYFDAPTDTGLAGLKPEKSDDDTALLDNLIDNKPDKPEDKKPDDDLDDDDKKPDEDLLEDDDDLLEDDDDDDDKKPKKPEDDDDDDVIGDDTSNARGLDLKKIKEKFPEFAKTGEFKELRNAYHREAQYTELFPTIEDAREAAENNETFTKLNHEIFEQGTAEGLLKAIATADGEAFKKVANGILDGIAKIDNTTYVSVITPVVRRLAKQMYQEGRKELNRNNDSDYGKALVATAKNIMKYAEFDDGEIDKDEPRQDNTLSEKEKDLQNREATIKQEKFVGAYRICDTSVEKHLDKAILDGLDPDNKFNEFTRDILLEKIKNEVKEQIQKDTSHLKRMTSLWKRAEQSGYNRESLSRIVSAYLERARPIIPNVRAKIRSNAIKGTKDTGRTEDKNIRLVNRGRTGRAPDNDGKTNVRAVDPKKIDYKNTSDNDIFEGKVKLKG